ncbi:MAG: ORF6N domain-containing protein [Oscillospiraceae bacterium]
MAQLIKINKQNLPVKEYKGHRVVTFGDIDIVHGRTKGTAHRNFKANRNRFIEGVDYFRRNSSEAKTEYGITAPNGLILITESGYLMLAKSFTDDIAWTVQRELVNCYFRNKPMPKQEEPEQLTLETAEYHYFDKTYKGEPVLTATDVEYFTGLNQHCVAWYIKKYGKKGKDFFLLTHSELMAYKQENPSVSRCASAAFLITRSGFKKALKYYDRKANMPECFIESKTPNLPEKDTAGTVEVKLPEKPEIQPRKHFSVAEYTIALEVVNALKIKAEERLHKPDCARPGLVQGNIRGMELTIQAIAVPLAVGSEDY